MLSVRPYPIKLFLPCLSGLLLLGGCSYHPLPESAAEPKPKNVVSQPAEETSDTRPAPVAGGKTREDSTSAEKNPRKPLSLPPAPEDEALSLEPAGAIMIRLPRAP